jgi:hypothetical protein
VSTASRSADDRRKRETRDERAADDNEREKLEELPVRNRIVEEEHGGKGGPTPQRAVEDSGEVQADEEEDSVLQQELDGSPVDRLGDSGLR